MKIVSSYRKLNKHSLLGSWQSTFTAYGMLIILFAILPFFGHSPVQIKAGYLIIILVNLSTLILTFNAIKQKNKKPFILWMLINSPLWLFIPIEISILLNGIKGLIALLWL
tara:strand:+ start:3558 stop:3890 length:333 start_codon:yes stop_codon:yes gene_type:complete